MINSLTIEEIQDALLLLTRVNDDIITESEKKIKAKFKAELTQALVDENFHQSQNLM